MRKLVLAAATAALAASAAAPADARHRHRHRDDVDAGDVIAGAIVVGGIAALLSGSSEARRRRQDAAVDLCSGEAESRTGDRVAAITGVSRRRGYYTVLGELARHGGDFGDRFRCTIRNGTIYSFDLRPGGA